MPYRLFVASIVTDIPDLEGVRFPKIEVHTDPSTGRRYSWAGGASSTGSHMICTVGSLAPDWSPLVGDPDIIDLLETDIPGEQRMLLRGNLVSQYLNPGRFNNVTSRLNAAGFPMTGISRNSTLLDYLKAIASHPQVGVEDYDIDGTWVTLE